MLLYNILITASITVIFYLVYLLIHNNYKKTQLIKRLVDTVAENHNKKNTVPDNKSQLTELLSRKISGFIGKVIPANIIRNVEKKIITANLSDFDVSQYFLMKIVIDLLILILLPLGLLALEMKQNPGLTAFLLIVGFMAPDILLKEKITKRHQEITKALPNFIDLLRICVEAGLDLQSAFGKMIKEDSSILQPELEQVFTEIKMGKPLSEALRDMADRLNHPDFSSFVTILLQANQMGMSIAHILRTQSEQIYLKYIQAVRVKAAKVPVLILLPLVFFILPALLTVLIGPAILQILEVYK